MVLGVYVRFSGRLPSDGRLSLALGLGLARGFDLDFSVGLGQGLALGVRSDRLSLLRLFSFLRTGVPQAFPITWTVDGAFSCNVFPPESSCRVHCCRQSVVAA